MEQSTCRYFIAKYYRILHEDYERFGTKPIYKDIVILIVILSVY